MSGGTEGTIEGQCFCGKLAIRVTGTPEGMGYCHCTDCRAWSASPVNAFTLWKPEQVEITSGEDALATYAKTDRSHRQFCSRCGGHVLTQHPGMGLVDVFAAVIPDVAFRPALHIHYRERALAIPDGLPKYADLPESFGGSGETLSE